MSLDLVNTITVPAAMLLGAIGKDEVGGLLALVLSAAAAAGAYFLRRSVK